LRHDTALYELSSQESFATDRNKSRRGKSSQRERREIQFEEKWQRVVLLIAIEFGSAKRIQALPLLVQLHVAERGTKQTLWST
jgi:hypothetical protein